LGPQPFGLQPIAPGTAPAASSSAESAPEKTGDQFVLPFDPHAKASLPFELPEMPEMPGGPMPSPASPPPPLTMPGIGSMPGVRYTPGVGYTPDAPAPMPPPQTESPPTEGPTPEEIRSLNATVEPLLEETETKQIHIPCPAGHPLEISREMLGKLAECPLCNKRFRLRYEDSMEFQRRKAKLEQSRDEKAGQVWLAWAILAAVAILAGLAALAFLVK
jgi:hypothetical protein